MGESPTPAVVEYDETHIARHSEKRSDAELAILAVADEIVAFCEFVAFYERARQSDAPSVLAPVN